MFADSGAGEAFRVGSLKLTEKEKNEFDNVT
jgi:hypothetical protein